MIKPFRAVIAVFILFLLDKPTIGQENIISNNRLKFISFESGIDFLDSNIPDYDFIRGEVNNYSEGSATDHLLGYFQKIYFGMSLETRTKNNLFGITGGMRFSRINSSLGEESYWYENNTFYYTLLSQEETTTHFLRVEEINNSLSYLGIPVEVRILPFVPRVFNLYFKAGIELNYLLDDNSSIVFYDEAMDKYESDVLDKFNHPDHFFSTVYAAIGWNVHLKNDAKLNIEANVPSVFLFDYYSGLVNPSAGGGIRLYIQIPF